MPSGKAVRWAKIGVGDRVELKGAEWVVQSIEHGKKKAAVTVARGRDSFSGKLPLEDRVTRTGKGRPILVDDMPAPSSKAEKKARAALAERAAADVTRTPKPKVAKAKTGPIAWDAAPQSEGEANLVSILGARLVGVETGGKTGAYYVPPVDASTILAHLLLFHGKELIGIAEAGDYERALKLHAADHDRGDLATPHTHTETQPG